MKLGLVLGGGGLIGLGYHAGTIKALEERGVDVSVADVIVGTSAGAVIAAYLAAGWDPGAFFEYALGRHPDSIADPDEQRDEVRRLFEPLAQSRAERLRRTVGSAYSVAASRGMLRRIGGGRPPPMLLRRAFPGGMYSTEETRARFAQDLPERWPDREIYLSAADLYTGRRVLFGTEGAPRPPFPLAVAASTAIPGVFPAVRIEGRDYVDGGVVSATSLDVAAGAGCDRILCIAPLGFRRDIPIPRDPRKWAPVLVRTPFARTLRREVLAARDQGAHVLVARPWLSDLALHGANSMRHHDRAAVAEGARAGTHRWLDEMDTGPVLEAFSSSTGRAASPSAGG